MSGPGNRAPTHRMDVVSSPGPGQQVPGAVAVEMEMAEHAPRGMFAPLRQQSILDQLSAAGRVEVSRLAAEFGISNESIRKDLLTLEKRGLLRRVHGGAVAVDELGFEPPVEARTTRTAEKQAIARAALLHVPANGSVLLDAGSTTAQLAGLLSRHDLVVCTNSLPIAATLAPRQGITVRCLGGTIRKPTMAGVGPIALDALAATNVDVAFLGANGVSVERGCTTPDEQEATVKHRMLSSARRRILLVDHSKFDRRSLFRYAELADFDLVITDDQLPSADAETIRRAGVSLTIA